MKIKVIRESKGSLFSGHVYLYAWSDSNADFLEQPNGKKIYAIKLDYPDHNSIVSVNKPDSYFENHNSVILHSTVQFRDFSLKLLNSKFSNDTSYSEMHTNCVHSIVFALQMANINIDFNEERRCKHLIACCCCPTTLITPRELIVALKDNKSQIFAKDMRNGIKNEKTPLIDEINPTSKLTDKREQIKWVRLLENDAIEDEQLIASCLLTMPFCLFGGVGAIIASISTTPVKVGLLAMGAVSSVFGCGAPLATYGLFNHKINNTVKEIEEKNEKIYGVVTRAHSSI